MGKTTLAAMFPKPVFIRTEDGTASLVGNDGVSLFPLATSTQDVLDAIEALATEKHEHKTLVIDSITQLATLIESEIVAADPKASRSTKLGAATARDTALHLRSIVRSASGLVRLHMSAT
jgi:hypothetical protein